MVNRIPWEKRRELLKPIQNTIMNNVKHAEPIADKIFLKSKINARNFGWIVKKSLCIIIMWTFMKYIVDEEKEEGEQFQSISQSPGRCVCTTRVRKCNDYGRLNEYGEYGSE